MHVCMYMYKRLTYTYIQTYIHLWYVSCLYIYMHTHTYIHMCVCMYVTMIMRSWTMSFYIYIYIYIYIYTYMYAHIWTCDNDDREELQRTYTVLLLWYVSCLHIYIHTYIHAYIQYRHTNDDIHTHIRIVVIPLRILLLMSESKLTFWCLSLNWHFSVWV
jgi:hypothetical protein